MTPIWLDVLDETSRLCAAHGRTRPGRLGTPQAGATAGPGAAGPGHRRTQTGQESAHQRPDQRAGLPGRGRPDHCGPDGGPARRAATAPPWSGPPPRRPGDRPPSAPAPAERLPLPIEQAAARISAPIAAGPGADGTTHVEIGVPRGLLASGLTLVDTPGADGPDQARATNAFAALARPDAVLLVSDATRELSVAEVNLLLQLAQSHPNVIVVQTKIDMVPDWRTVADRNRQHLASAGVPAALIPVSAALRLQAARTDDKLVNAESRFPDLIARLLRDQGSKAEVLARTAVALLSRTVIEQLAAPLRAELTSAQSGDNSAAMGRLRAAQREVDELRRCATRWQNTLNDEMADLLSDIEYDLRDRTRKILRQVDEAFETADPQTGWDTFAGVAGGEPGRGGRGELRLAGPALRLDRRPGRRPVRPVRPGRTAGLVGPGPRRPRRTGAGAGTAADRAVHPHPEGGHRAARLVRRGVDVRPGDQPGRDAADQRGLARRRRAVRRQEHPGREQVAAQAAPGGGTGGRPAARRRLLPPAEQGLPGHRPAGCSGCCGTTSPR